MVDPNNVELFMSGIAVFSLTSWIPQIARMIKMKSTKEFSLWTTAILLICNTSWFAYALYITSPSLAFQQGLTMVMLITFTYLVIKYRGGPPNDTR